MINRASVQLWGHSETIGRPAKIGREKKLWPGGIARSCGTDPILSTQRTQRGRDPILSTQRIGGGDLEENGHFPKVKRFLLIIVYEMRNGGDLYKMTIFPR